MHIVQVYALLLYNHPLTNAQQIYNNKQLKSVNSLLRINAYYIEMFIEEDRNKKSHY